MDSIHELLASNYWEKQQLLLKRQRKKIILGVVFLFLVIASIPVIQDQWHRWRAQGLLNQMAILLSETKTQAIRDRRPLALIADSEAHEFRIMSVNHCGSSPKEELSGTLLKKVSFLSSYLSYQIRDRDIPLSSVVGVCYQPYTAYLVHSESENKKMTDSETRYLIAHESFDREETNRWAVLKLYGASQEITVD